MPINTKEHSTKIELHYYFVNKSHSMDALVRNKCEHEFLNLMQEVSSLLGVKVKIETEAHKKGGIKEIWSFIGTNSNQITILLLIATLLLSRVPTTNQEFELLKTEETKLSIEEKNLNIKKLKLELEKLSEDENKANEAVDELNSHLKIVKYKSNFYSHLFYYKKVTQISTSRLDSDNNKIDQELFVDRKDFERFMLNTDILSPEIDEHATVEIISPVLKRGNYKWKGIYLNEPISFYMKDKEFKTSVIKEGVPFKNGTFIECILEINRKIDNFGDVIISGYSATTVISKYDDVETVYTPQGKQYWQIKDQEKRQLPLFKNSDNKID